MRQPAPHRFVALLRGVNVGGRRRVPMEDLRRALDAAGFSGVRTYLQSGNVVFDAVGPDAPPHAETIALVLREGLGQDVDVLVIGCAELARIAAENPFAAQAEADDRSVHALLPFAPVTEHAIAALEPLAAQGEQAVRGDRAIYLYLPNGFGRSRLASAFTERSLGTPVTARNWRTVLALLAMCSEK